MSAVCSAHALDIGDFEVGGRASSGYEARWTGGNDHNDHDAFTTLYLKATQKEDGPLSAAALIDLNLNIDGGESKDSPFYDTWDTYNNDLQARLYLLYVDIEDVLRDSSKLRIGRQNVFSTDVVRFDGLKYETRFRDLEVYAFGGARYSFYSNQHDDAYTFGSGLKYYPARWTRLGLDYARSENDDNIGTDSLALSASQRFCKEFQVSARGRSLDDEMRDFRVRARVTIPQLDISAIGTYFKQVNPLGNFANEYSSFYKVEADYHPFEQYGISLYKSFAEHYTVSGGGQIRTVSDSGDVGSFNREFKRWYVALDSDKILDTPFRGSIGIDRWETDIRDRVTSVGADLGMTVMEDRLDLDIGTSYSAYKYNFLRQSEQSNVRTYFAQAGYELDENSKVILKLEQENDELDDDPFYTLKLRWKLSF